MLLCLNDKSLGNLVKDFQMPVHGSTISEPNTDSGRPHHSLTVQELELEDVVC